MTSGPPARDGRSGDFDIAIANEQTRHPVDEEQLCDAAHAVLQDSHFTTASISIALIDDATIHEINRRHLDHDWPADVLSFVLEETDEHLEGEVVLSAETAARAAAEMGWTAAAEQALYVIHGTLHLVGHRDNTPAETEQMRAAEAKYLRQLGLGPSRKSGDALGSGAADIDQLPGGTTTR